MTDKEFQQLSDYAAGLWPQWKPTPEQIEAWRSKLQFRSLQDCKAALQGGYALGKWKEPNLADVLKELPKLIGSMAIPAMDGDKAAALIEADNKLRRESSRRMA